MSRRILLGIVVLAAGLVLPATASGAEVSAVRPLYVTNSGRDIAGGLGAHPVSTFGTDRAGLPVAVGEPVPTGAGARGIVFAPDGRHAYVVALEENAVYPYAIDGRGALTPLGAPVPVGAQSPFGIT